MTMNAKMDSDWKYRPISNSMTVWNIGITSHLIIWPFTPCFYIRQIQGGDHVFIKSADSRLKLRSASVTTAIEDARIDKMEEFDEKEQNLLLRDIPKSEPFCDILDPDCMYTNISEWLTDVFGGSSQKFKMTYKYSWPTVVFGGSCYFRGDASIPIDCLVDHQWGVKLDQDICITKVDADKDADDVPQESKAESVAIDGLFDFESTSIASQIGHSVVTVVQNPWISHSIALGIGCVLPIIFKMIIKRMKPQRVRRRIVRPQVAMLVQNGMLTQNQED